MGVEAGVGVSLGEGEKWRGKGKGKDLQELGGVGGWKLRKGRYRSKEEDIHIKGAILGLARDLALEGIPGVHGMSPARSLDSIGEGA